MSGSSEIDEKLRSNYKKYVSRISLFRIDPAWLRRNDPLLELSARDKPDFDYLDYYLGRQEARAPVSPNPLFDWAFYNERTNYLGRGGRSPIEYDFMSNGAERNATGLWLFRNEHFATLKPEPGDEGFTKSELEALRHNYGSYYLAFLHNIERFQRASPLFSMRYYKHRVGEPNLSNRDAVVRYVSGDHAEGLHGSPLFDDAWYTARYEDALSVGAEAHHRYRSPIQHFLTEGVLKGFSPIPDFDAEFYLAEYPKAAKEIAQGLYRSPVDHFLGHLREMNRKPNPYFDPDFYLAEYADVRREMDDWGLMHPLEHFLHAGSKRGYRASKPLSQVRIPENYAKAGFERRAALVADQHILSGRRADLSTAAPRLSAVIPVCNHFAFTASLLVQLAREYGPDSRTPVQAIVVDNGSTDRTVELPRLFPDAVYIRVEEPIGYTAACNMGAKAATAPVIAFLNNDIELGPAVFHEFADALDADPTLAAVGPKIVLTDGTVQEAGGVVFANGGTAGFGRGMPPTREVVNIARDVDYISGCALAVRREVFERIGAFDELFSPGYFEDVDLCLRIWADGGRVRYLPQAFITHYEYGTYSKGRPKEISFFHMFANKAKYLAKHRETLSETAAPAVPFDLSAAAFRRGAAETRTVLFIEDLAPSGQYGSGFVRSEDVVREFISRGWRVTVFALSARAGDDAFVERYRGQADLRYLKDITLEQLLGELGGALKLVWVCRTHNIANLRNELLHWRRHAPGRRLVADTEALASLRTAFPGEGPGEIAGDPKAVRVVAEELKPAAEFDEVICVNSHEARLAREALPKTQAHVLGHRFETRRPDTGFAARRDLVFCGAIHETYSPNMDSLRWFCADILPRIRERLPDVGFSFVGYLRQGLKLPPEVTEHTKVLGRVDDLSTVFDTHRVFVAPTRLAAGVPHKVQQAMALGIPCVVTANLAGQLESAPDLQPFVTAAVDPQAFADACVRLYTDEALWTRVQADAFAEIARSASADAFARQMDAILEAVHG